MRYLFNRRTAVLHTVDENQSKAPALERQGKRLLVTRCGKWVIKGGVESTAAANWESWQGRPSVPHRLCQKCRAVL